ncbi:hypothetical protein FQN50_000688 [Emmonsiellopsis sp. PD_5]|nr:hypothetical protein FQN50_000688 [Emmonsiellopsis sp. PD_5]
MAAPNLGVIPIVQGQQTHFWDPEQEAHSLITNFRRLAPNSAQEDIVDHVWAGICHTYFPHIATTPQGPRWAVLREPYRGPPGHLTAHKPNVLVVRLQPQPGPGGLQINRRDYLWVECKPPSHDKPSGWKDLINEATQRLASAHPQRRVSVIVAIGFKMMAFVWDPTIAPANPQLSIRATSPPTRIWPLDPHLRSWHTGGWVNPTTGRIDLSRALSVDCVTLQTVNGQRVLRWRNDLPRIEQVLVSVRVGALPGFNANHWSS